MEIGRRVILLNLDDLYESLYDALNLTYTWWDENKFVDIGLGTHRVKAFVHDDFRYNTKMTIMSTNCKFKKNRVACILDFFLALYEKTETKLMMAPKMKER